MARLLIDCPNSRGRTDMLEVGTQEPSPDVDRFEFYLSEWKQLKLAVTVLIIGYQFGTLDEVKHTILPQQSLPRLLQVNTTLDSNSQINISGAGGNTHCWGRGDASTYFSRYVPRCSLVKYGLGPSFDFVRRPITPPCRRVLLADILGDWIQSLPPTTPTNTEGYQFAKDHS